MTTLPITIADLDQALTFCRTNEYNFSLYCYGAGKITVSLGKKVYSDHTEVAIRGTGDTVAEALEAALRQFPTNPLDGVSRWASNQLAAPANGE